MMWLQLCLVCEAVSIGYLEACVAFELFKEHSFSSPGTSEGGI